MSLMFAIYGVSGAGKTTLLKILEEINLNISVHIKDATRKADKSEIDAKQRADLNFINNDSFDRKHKDGVYEVVYMRYGNRYGIVKKQIDNAFSAKKIHCIIVRDIIALKTLKSSFANMKTIYFHVDPNNIPERLSVRDRYDKKERAERIQGEFKEFIENSVFFDHIIVNFWEISNAVRQFQNIIDYYNKSQ